MRTLKQIADFGWITVGVLITGALLLLLVLVLTIGTTVLIEDDAQALTRCEALLKSAK